MLSTSSDTDRVISFVQASTRKLMNSFQEKTELLRQCSADIKQLIRESYDRQIAYETAGKLFGGSRAKFLAIDGTESKDEMRDMLVFYAGAFGYVGELEFSDKANGCKYTEPIQVEGSTSMSAAIPIHEQDTASVAGNSTEGGIEVDTARIPMSVMHLAEYYMAVNAVNENPDIKVVILDRTLAGDVAHLVWSVNEMLESGSCILEGINTVYGKVTAFDLELARMLHPSEGLKIPAPRSHLIKYAAINQLFRLNTPISYEELIKATGANKARLEKLKGDFGKWDNQYSFLDSAMGCALKNGVAEYWQRVLPASMQLCDHIFNAPEGKHPLILEDSHGNARWITSNDIDYLVLIMIYALLRMAWERNLLVIGIIKDVAAGEMVKTVIPLLQASGRARLARELPLFNSDKMLLQSASVINSKNMTAPWRTFEFDACFRTIAPVNVDSKNELGEAAVAGAFKNLISAERMFVKSYIQLWSSADDPAVRSHVFCYDRPCYPEFDMLPVELTLKHKDGDVEETITPAVHFQHDSAISHLVMDILCSMACEVIPECLGHNYPLFLADKKAKSILEGSKSAYLSAVAFEMANSQFDQQILFEARFRDYRSEIESKRRSRT